MQQQITERSCGCRFIGRFLYSCFYECLLRYRRTNVKPEKLISTINFFLSFFFCLLFFVLRKQLRLSFNCMTAFTIIGLIICENNTVIITLCFVSHIELYKIEIIFLNLDLALTTSCTGSCAV